MPFSTRNAVKAADGFSLTNPLPGPRRTEFSTHGMGNLAETNSMSTRNHCVSATPRTEEVPLQISMETWWVAESIGYLGKNKIQRNDNTKRTFSKG